MVKLTAVNVVKNRRTEKRGREGRKQGALAVAMRGVLSVQKEGKEVKGRRQLPVLTEITATSNRFAVEREPVEENKEINNN